MNKSGRDDNSRPELFEDSEEDALCAHLSEAAGEDGTEDSQTAGSHDNEQSTNAQRDIVFSVDLAARSRLCRRLFRREFRSVFLWGFSRHWLFSWGVIFAGAVSEG